MESRPKENKVLVTISDNKSGIFGQFQKTLFVPKDASLNYIRTFVSAKSALHSKNSIFLFCYGCILTNNETMEDLSQRFRHEINPKKGIEINYAQMASF